MDHVIRFPGFASDFWDADYRVPTINVRRRHLRMGDFGLFCSLKRKGDWGVVRKHNPIKALTCEKCVAIMHERRRVVWLNYAAKVLRHARDVEEGQAGQLADLFLRKRKRGVLQILADWYDEQDDPRGELLRIEAELMGPMMTPARYCLLQNKRIELGQLWLETKPVIAGG